MRDQPISRHPHDAGLYACLGRAAYFSELLIAVNLVLSLVPRPFTTAMIASAMPAAISPYSIAVAPVSSARKLRIVFMVCYAAKI
jgi:hypothetical protein